MASKLKKILKWTLRVVVTLCLLGFIYQTISQSSDKKKHPPVGQIYDVGGINFHLHSQGEGGPTILLISGGGDVEAIWEPVQRSLKDKTTVISYDRPGLGHSDFYREDDLTLEKQAELLYEALQKSGNSGPYIVVGHSIGGLIARNFARRYRKDVAGVLLVDSSVEGQFSKLPEEILQTNKSAGAVFSIANALAKVGLPRLFGMGTAKANSFAVLTDDAKVRIASALHQSRGFRAIQKDGAVADLTMEKGDPFPQGALDSIPLTIITRGLAEHEIQSETEFTEERIELFSETQARWLELQEGLLQISSNSKQVIAKNSGHYIHTSEPEVVITEIEKMLQLYLEGSL